MLITGWDARIYVPAGRCSRLASRSSSGLGCVRRRRGERVQEGKKLGWGGVFWVVAVGAVLAYFKVPLWWVVSAIVFGYLAMILPAWWLMRRRVRGIHGQDFTWRWAEASTPSSPELDAELRALGYELAGIAVATTSDPAAPDWPVPVYVHATLPIYATLIPLGEGVPPLCLLETFFSDHAWLGTSFDTNDAVYWMGAKTGTRRLLQLSRDHRLAALHAGHETALDAWIAEGHHPLPATQEAYFALQEAERDRLRTGLAQPSWLSLAEYMAVKRGEAVNCVWL